MHISALAAQKNEPVDSPIINANAAPIKGAVEKVKGKINEYEESKNSFIDPEANKPYVLSNISQNRHRSNSGAYHEANISQAR